MAAGEIATLVTDATPYLTAALTAYGVAVLIRVRDDAADTTVDMGRRLLQRVFGHRNDGEQLPAVLAEAVGAPNDLDTLGSLRLAIRRELEADRMMLADVREILASARTPAQTMIIHSGRDTYSSGRDMTINRRVDLCALPLLSARRTRPGNGERMRQ